MQSEIIKHFTVVHMNEHNNSFFLFVLFCENVNAKSSWWYGRWVRDGCEGSDGLGGKQGSSPNFLDAFSSNQPQNKSLQVILQDVLMHLQDVLMLLQDPLYSYRIWKQE